jgi:hypothetical protein
LADDYQDKSLLIKASAFVAGAISFIASIIYDFKQKDF